MTKGRTKGQSKALARWVSWIFELGLLAGVVMFATHYSQEMAFAQLLLHARPAWLLVAILLQMGTYMTDARIWQRVLARANISRPLRSYVGLGLAKLFMDQAIPSVGLSGTLLVIRVLDSRGVPRGASMAAVVIDLVSYYAAYTLCLGIALAIVWVHRRPYTVDGLAGGHLRAHGSSRSHGPPVGEPRPDAARLAQAATLHQASSSSTW